MMPGPMPRAFLKNRAARALTLCLAAGALSLSAAACGTQKISVPRSDPTFQGAVLFYQHCGGCHTLSYAGTHGSAYNVTTREYENGPNFDQRCERPVARILYALANGGFSGAIMPQNIVVGQQAVEVAEFVAKYSGRRAPHVSGLPSCAQQPIGTVPNFSSGTAVTPVTRYPNSSATPTTTTATVTTVNASKTPKSQPSSAPSNKKGNKAAKNTGQGGKSAGA
jgi:hypothetical protein